MNFYIVKKYEDIDVEDDNYEFNDEVLDLLFKNKNYFPDKLNYILSIDPYDDNVVEGEDLVLLKKEFEDIIAINSKTNFLNQENLLLIKEINVLIEKAIYSNKIIAIIGD